mmetsp:Transcript_62668/g.204534  ORF Transcript_62668/g.204534 Transcript_62668/m.204534 type:complete len:101 (-) Transcript_62668:2719-3021(-)
MVICLHLQKAAQLNTPCEEPNKNEGTSVLLIKGFEEFWCPKAWPNKSPQPHNGSSFQATRGTNESVEHEQATTKANHACCKGYAHVPVTTCDYCIGPWRR